MARAKGSLDQLFIARVLADQDMRAVLEAKITSDFFVEEDVAEVWDWLLDYYREYGGVPSVSTLKREFPNFKLIKPSDPIDYFLDNLRNRREFEILAQSLVEMSGALDERDLEAAKAAMSQGLVRAGTETSGLRDTNLMDNWEQRLERYEEWRAFREQGGLRGIPSGFPTIDQATLGFQEQNLVTFVGQPKAGKSTLMLVSAINAHNAGRTILFVGFEMSNEEQEARYDSIRAKVSYTGLLSGRLGSTDRKKLAKDMKRRRGMQDFILSSDIESATTVSGLSAKIDQYRPDILFVDGVYLMDDELGEPKGSAQALTNITRSLKRLAQKQRIPIVCSTQVLTWKLGRRRGITQDSIGYSSSFAQDSDLIVGVEHTEDEEMKKVRIVEGRAAPRREVLIRWDWETGEFEEVDPYGDEEEEGAEEAEF